MTVGAIIQARRSRPVSQIPFQEMKWLIADVVVDEAFSLRCEAAEQKLLEAIVNLVTQELCTTYSSWRADELRIAIRAGACSQLGPMYVFARPSLSVLWILTTPVLCVWRHCASFAGKPKSHSRKTRLWQNGSFVNRWKRLRKSVLPMLPGMDASPTIQTRLWQTSMTCSVRLGQYLLKATCPKMRRRRRRKSGICWKKPSS